MELQYGYVPAETPASQNGSLSVTNMGGMDSSANQAKAFQDCIRNYGSDISKCQFYVDMLNECRRGPAPEEAERIEQLQVFALQDGPDMARLWLPHGDSHSLGMARAFGDFCLKNFGFIVVPDISYHPHRKGWFIVLATDGNENEWSHYVKTGQCKFGVTCKFHHPQPVGPSVAIPGPSSYYPAGPSLPIPSPQPYAGGLTTWPISRTPLMANPYLQGPSTYVPFVIPHGMMPVPGWNSFHGQVGSITSRDVGQQAPGTGLFYGPRYQTDGMNPNIQGALASYSSRSGSMGIPSSNTQMEHMFPERHGQPECQFYMRTGYCKYGSTCKYHHPRDRTVPLTSCTLSPLGLPLRSGTQTCSFYARQGFCKYGPTCKYDHPMGTLSYSPSASSLADMPVAPYPVGSSPATLAPSFSSTELRTEATAGLFKESTATPETPLSSSAGEAIDLGAQGPLLSTSTGLTFSESEENPLVKKSNQVSVLANGIAKEVDIPISN